MSTASYFLTFTEGILTFISPCILPMLPIYFIYLSGLSEKEVEKTATDKNTLLINSIGFVIGFTLVFTALGATVTALGHFLTNHRDILQKVSGLVMIAFGLNFMGILNIRLFNTEKRINYTFDRLGFFSSIIFGLAFGFGWTPCLGAFLGSALALASNSQTIYQGIILLLIYSIGLGIPFILTSMLFDKMKILLIKIQKYGRLISIISGFLLALAGILIFFGTFKFFSYI